MIVEGESEYEGRVLPAAQSFLLFLFSSSAPLKSAPGGLRELFKADTGGGGKIVKIDLPPYVSELLPTHETSC